MKTAFCYIVDLPIFVLALLCLLRTVENLLNNFTWQCLVRIFGNKLSMSMSVSIYVYVYRRQAEIHAS